MRGVTGPPERPVHRHEVDALAEPAQGDTDEVSALAVALRVPFDPALARGGPVAFDPQALRARTRPVVVAWQQHAARVLGR